MATIDDFINKMKGQRGKPYVYGAADPNVGFDCSGLIHWALKQLGIHYTHQSMSMINEAKQISVPDAINTKGALLYRYGHIVVSLGNGQIIEAAEEGIPVHIVDLYDRNTWTQGGIITELTNTPTKPKAGFLMALSDSDQSILFNRVKNILDELTLGKGQHLVETVYTQMKESRDVLTGQTGKPNRYNGPDQLKHMMNIQNDTLAAIKSLTAAVEKLS